MRLVADFQVSSTTATLVFGPFFSEPRSLELWMMSDGISVVTFQFFATVLDRSNPSQAEVQAGEPIFQGPGNSLLLAVGGQLATTQMSFPLSIGNILRRYIGVTITEQNTDTYTGWVGIYL